MPIRPPLPRGGPPRRFVEATQGDFPQGRCSPQAKSASIPWDGQPPQGDTEWGRYTLPVFKTGSVALMVVDDAGPPPIYVPAFEVDNVTNPYESGVAVEVEIPLGFIAWTVKLRCAVIDSAWEDAVQWKLYCGTQVMLDFDGAAEATVSLSNAREGREGQKVRLCARIAPAYSTGGATPLTDLVYGSGELEVMLLKNADRKMGC